MAKSYCVYISPLTVTMFMLPRELDLCSFLLRIKIERNKCIYYGVKGYKCISVGHVTFSQLDPPLMCVLVM